jgi:hypothetical protein
MPLGKRPPGRRGPRDADVNQLPIPAGRARRPSAPQRLGTADKCFKPAERPSGRLASRVVRPVVQHAAAHSPQCAADLTYWTLKCMQGRQDRAEFPTRRRVRIFLEPRGPKRQFESWNTPPERPWREG